MVIAVVSTVLAIGGLTEIEWAERGGWERKMGWRELVQETWDIVPIFLLLLVGGAIAVGSGASSAGGKQTLGRLVKNVSQIALRLVGYMAVLLMIQYCIGLRPSLGW